MNQQTQLPVQTTVAEPSSGLVAKHVPPSVLQGLGGKTQELHINVQC